MFQSGVPLPSSVWSDYRTGTSLAGDIAQLIGGGLTRIGGIKRQEDKEAKDRAFREAEAARQASQFDRTLAQSDAHFNLSREDKYRLEAMKQAQSNGWTLDDNGEPVWSGGATQAYEPPTMSVPDAKAAGADYQAKYGADPMDVDSPTTPQEKAAMAGGGFTAPVAAAAPRTALAGARTPPLAVLKASQTAKERIVDNKRADESLGISRDRLALSKQTQARLEADALAKQEKDAAELRDLNDSLAREGALPQNTRLAGGDAMREATGAGGGLMPRTAPTVDGMSVTPYASSDVAKMALTDVFSRRRAAEGGDRTSARQEDRQEFTREMAQEAAKRRAAIDVRKAERDAMAQAVAQGKASVDQIKAEAQLVEREIETMLDTTDPFARGKLATDPTFKDLLDKRGTLAASLQKAIGAAVPTAPVGAPAPAAPTGGYPSWLQETDAARKAWDVATADQKAEQIKKRGR